MTMQEIWLKTELLSDVVITSNAATVGGHVGLDYLPGALFLGVAAGLETARSGFFDAGLFLGGNIVFGDAFPALGEKASFPIPLAYHYGKQEGWKDKKPLNPLVEPPDPQIQPKQLREGWMTCDGKVEFIQKSVRMKTAVDRSQRRALEGHLFGYEAIPAGKVFYSRIQVQDQRGKDLVYDWFKDSIIRVGRSRSAEYGRARTRIVEPPVGWVSGSGRHRTGSGKRMHFYLLSDLALERDGFPTSIPKGSDFGLPDAARLVSSATFMRVRTYTPWNSYFNYRMYERVVLCKGSVITFALPDDMEVNESDIENVLSKGIGLYVNEGLGQVLLNPDWLLNAPVLSEHVEEQVSTGASKKPIHPLVACLEEKVKTQRMYTDALKNGLQLAEMLFHLWKELKKRNGEDHVPGKSQWNNLRLLAFQGFQNPGVFMEKLKSYCNNSLRKKLWVESSTRDGKNLYSCLEGYLLGNPDKQKCMDIYHAAIEMSRRIAR